MIPKITGTIEYGQGVSEWGPRVQQARELMPAMLDTLEHFVCRRLQSVMTTEQIVSVWRKIIEL